MNNLQRYQDLHTHASTSAAEFWLEQAHKLPWFKRPQQALDDKPLGKQSWFADGEMNTAYMALDYHVEQGRGEQVALYYDSPLAEVKASFTYSQLLQQVAQTAGMLQHLGVAQGDRVVIYMPMVPEAVIAMLACARIGAIHSVVFGGFAARELAVRVDDAKPKVVLTASCGLEPGKVVEYYPLLTDALSQAEFKPAACVVLLREQLTIELTAENHYDWSQLLAASGPASYVAVSGDHPLYILYTSGTTGKPKGVVRENGGHAVAMHYSMQAIYNSDVGDVYWAASDVGWVVGHSYIVYAPLLRGCTTVLYEGKPVATPDAGSFWRVIEEYQVKALFSAPTAFRAIKKEDSEGKLLQNYNLSSLNNVFVAGERLDPPTYHWLSDLLQRPIIDHWWQTETGWAIAANMTGFAQLPCKAGSSTVPMPGYDVCVVDDEGNELSPNQQGHIVLKLPLPPSCFNTLWNDAERYTSSYLAVFPGYYNSGDGGYIDKDGYLFVMGRLDDVINVAGHRLSTGEMEEVLGEHASVAECAVVAQDDDLKGQLPVGLVVLKTGVEIDEQELSEQLVSSVRNNIGAIACFKQVHVVQRLPKTRSGKTLRKTLRQIVNGQSYSVPSTIDDPDSLTEIEALLSRL